MCYHPKLQPIRRNEKKIYHLNKYWKPWAFLPFHYPAPSENMHYWFSWFSKPKWTKIACLPCFKDLLKDNKIGIFFTLICRKEFIVLPIYFETLTIFHTDTHVQLNIKCQPGIRLWNYGELHGLNILSGEWSFLFEIFCLMFLICLIWQTNLLYWWKEA